MSKLTYPHCVSFKDIHSFIPDMVESLFIYYDPALGNQIPPIKELLSEKYALHWLEETGKDKSLNNVTRIWQWLHEGAATRQALLVCIGGGRISDLGGFAASTFKRGIPYINIPTTLLAMVDASVGGKTGFNFAGVKNEIGSFYPPIETLIDTNWLTSLPEEEIWSGYAEMIKHSLLADRDAYYHLIATEPYEDIDKKIRDSIAIKWCIVSKDTEELGLRKSLNFGHTIGHALESKYHYPHGYAVMYGMVAELYLSVVLKELDRNILRQMTHYMIEHYGKPICRCNDYDELIELMRQDKKNLSEKRICFTLLSNIETGSIQSDDKKLNGVLINEEVSPIYIKEALDYLFSV